MNRERIATEYGWRETVRLLRMQIDPITEFAFDCLETRGLRFCVHFGTKNALELASDEWLTRLDAGKYYR